MKTTTGVKINGHVVGREDFKELILNLQATARALREYKEGKEENKDE